jgi:hypothetical protein
MRARGSFSEEFGLALTFVALVVLLLPSVLVDAVCPLLLA